MVGTCVHEMGPPRWIANAPAHTHKHTHRRPQAPEHAATFELELPKCNLRTALVLKVATCDLEVAASKQSRQCLGAREA